MIAIHNRSASVMLYRVARCCVAILVLALQLAALGHIHAADRAGADDSHCAWCAVAHSPVVLTTAPPQPARPLTVRTPPAVRASCALPARTFDSAPARAPPTS